MFQTHSTGNDKLYRRAVIGLSLFSCAALLVTVWMMVDFLREQAIVEGLIRRLPADAKSTGEFLAGELRWQFRLTILVILNVMVTAIAIILLGRAYGASQTSLRDVKALACDVLSSMEQGVITTDLHGQVTSINRRGAELLGADLSILEQPLEALGHPALAAIHQQWLEGRGQTVVRETLIHNRGTPLTLRVTCQALSDPDGNEVGSVIGLLDITVRKLIEDRMRRMERYMGLGSLAGGLQHEIKNPLTALSLHVQLLEEQLAGMTPDEEVRRMLAVIRTEVARIGGVLEAFRDFASIDKLELQQVDLCELIWRQIDLVRPQAARQGVTLRGRCPADPVFATIDCGRFEQVLLNLMLNALEAMPNGGELSISAALDGPMARVEISDTGGGIPENLQDKILDPYFTTKSHGTGLGLAFCEKIIRQHDGALDFHSSPAGTTFSLTVPRMVAQLQEA